MDLAGNRHADDDVSDRLRHNKPSYLFQNADRGELRHPRSNNVLRIIADVAVSLMSGVGHYED